MSERKPVVLFLCTANSCRSQMAESILRHKAGERFKVISAGLRPAPAVHPLALQVLAKKGYPVDGLQPKSVKEFLGRVRLDQAVVVCASAARECPTVWPGGAERLFWPFDDPAAAEGTDEEVLAEFRRVRDEIGQRLTDWLEARPAGS